MQEYEYYDLILNYLLERRQAIATNIIREVDAFAGQDPVRVNLWLKRMNELVPDYVGLKKAHSVNMLVLTDYTTIFQQDGGFKALFEKQQKKQQVVKVNFQRADGSNPLADLHPEVQDAAGQLFADGHLTAAVNRACVALEVKVRGIVASGGKTTIGVKLMNDAFGSETPKIRLATEPSEQLGFQSLFAGVMGTMRNAGSHRVDVLSDPQEAHEWLSFLSLLFRVLDDAPSQLSDQ